MRFDNSSGTPVNYTYYTATSFWPTGAPYTTQFGNGAQEYDSYGTRLQPTSSYLNSSFGTSQVHVFDRSYDFGSASHVNNGNVRTIFDNTWNSNHASDNARTQYFTYDNLNRICSASEGPSTPVSGSCAIQTSVQPGRWAYNFSIDPWGNLWQKTHTKGTWPDLNAPTDAATNRLTGFTYDAAGNVTNNGSRITSTGSGTVYTYGADGQRVMKTNSAYLPYVYLNGQVIQEWKPGGRTNYVYANGKRIAEVDDFDNVFQITGTRTTSTGWDYAWACAIPLPTGLSNRTIMAGDRLVWRNYQTGTARGGLGMWTDITGSINLHLTDQDGVAANSDTTMNAWHFRAMDISPMAGQHFQGVSIGVDGNTTQGSWGIQFDDVAYVAADGSVFPFYVKGQGQIATCNISSGMTGVAAATTLLTGLNVQTQQTAYYHGDHLGSARIMTQARGWPVWQATYMPYGEEVEGLLTTNHYKFTGKERDSETGLDYFGARYYGSNMGRFQTPDPLGGHLEDPQTLNRYGYVRNNPLTLTDPTGLDFYLRCDKDSSTCQNHHVGTTDDKGNFTATVVTSDSIRNGQNSGSIDQNGVEITTGGKSYQGEYFDNPASHSKDSSGNDVNNNPIDLKGSGALGGFSFHIDGNCGGTCLASGSFSFPGPRDFTGQVLELRGSFRSIADRRIPGWGKSIDEWEFHPGTEQYRFGKGPSPHFSLPDNPKNTVPTKGPFHVDTDAPGLKHLGCAKLGVGCN